MPSRDLDTAAVLSFAKLGRIFRVGRLVKKLDKFTAARFVRVANVLIFILLTTNALACIWWRIGYDTPEFRGWQFRPHAAATLLQYNPMDADDELLVLPTGMLNKTRLYELFQTEVGAISPMMRPPMPMSHQWRKGTENRARVQRRTLSCIRIAINPRPASTSQRL